MSPYRLFYQEKVGPALQQHFNYPNLMQIPKLDKIALNIGVGEAIQNSKLLDNAVEETDTDCWAAGNYYPCEEKRFRFQNSRWDVHRL